MSIRSEIPYFLWSAIICIAFVAYIFYLEKDVCTRRKLSEVVAKVAVYAMCALCVAVVCAIADKVGNHWSSIAYLLLVFICDGVAYLMSNHLCPDANWDNFKFFIEGFIFALGAIFATLHLWSVSATLWVYIIGFYFDFDFLSFRDKFDKFIKGGIRILINGLVILVLFGAGYVLGLYDKEHEVAIALPWVIMFIVGIIWILIIMWRQRKAGKDPQVTDSSSRTKY